MGVGQIEITFSNCGGCSGVVVGGSISSRSSSSSAMQPENTEARLMMKLLNTRVKQTINRRTSSPTCVSPV